MYSMFVRRKSVHGGWTLWAIKCDHSKESYQAILFTRTTWKFMISNIDVTLLTLSLLPEWMVKFYKLWVCGWNPFQGKIMQSCAGTFNDRRYQPRSKICLVLDWKQINWWNDKQGLERHRLHLFANCLYLAFRIVVFITNITDIMDLRNARKVFQFQWKL